MTNKALVKPIDTTVLPPRTNPLDSSTQLQTATQMGLTASDETAYLTTPEAGLEFTELTDEEQENDGAHTSQSTLGGATFHSAPIRKTKLGDGDESQSWQITQTRRGTGQTEN